MRPTAAFWFRILLHSILVMAIGLALSLMEVFIYSLIVPGKGLVFYEMHAVISSVWVIAISGVVFMYIFTWQFIKKNAGLHLLYALALPTCYTVLNLLVLYFTHTLGVGSLMPFLISNGLKYAGALLAYALYGRRTIHN